MEIKFKDKQKIALIDTENAAEIKLPISVIKSCRRKFNLLRSAPDERTLRNWKSFHYEKLQGGKEERRSIRLNDQWRLIILLDDTCNPPNIIILGIEDYH